MEHGNAALQAAQEQRRRETWRGGVVAPRRQTIREIEDEERQRIRRDLAEKAGPKAYAALGLMVDQALDILAKGGTPTREHSNAINKTLNMAGVGAAPPVHEEGLAGLTVAQLDVIIARCEAEAAEQRAHNAAIEGELAAQAIEDLI